MNSAILTALVIMSYTCLIAAYEVKQSRSSFPNNTGQDEGYCSYTVPKKARLQNNLNMPIPFTTNLNNPSIIYPNENGVLNFKFDTTFKLTCTSAKFKSNSLQHTNEVLVSCVQGEFMHNNIIYKYTNFWCDELPLSKLIVTEKQCKPNNKNIIVVWVGFQTSEHFLILYSTCFNKLTKQSLYTWHNARSPYFRGNQVLDATPIAFISDKELYGDMNMDEIYTIKQQRETVAKILDSNDLAKRYIMDDRKHYLAKGHLAAKIDFYYSFEQYATFYYVNVAPQWQLFNNGAWKMIERIVRLNMDRSQSSRQVIVAGTYGSCRLYNIQNSRKSLFLNIFKKQKQLPVPMFYWKLHYEVFEDPKKPKGTVYIGLNNPYQEVNQHLCKNICKEVTSKYEENQEGKENNAIDKNSGLIYCCTQEDFEEFYGKIYDGVFE